MLRAGTLISRARQAAQETKASVALEGYWKGGAGARIAAAGVGGVAGTVLSTLAVSGAIAGGVAFGAATLGIGPAVTIVLTVSILKVAGGFIYMQNSKKVKGALKGSATSAGAVGSHTLVEVSLLSATAAKVMKKLKRIEIRLTQVGPNRLGSVGRTVMKIWNPRTALKEFGTPGAQAPFSDHLTIQDATLNALLRQLRFYGQVLFNSVDAILDAFVTEKRDLLGGAYAELCGAVVEYGRAAATDHSRCSPSACMLRNHSIPGSLELKKIVDALNDAGIPVTPLGEAAEGPQIVGSAREAATRHAQLREAQGLPMHRPGASANDRITELSGAALYVAPEATALLHSALLPTSTAPAVTGAGMYVGAAGGAVVAELTATIQNRLTRASVLKDSRIRSAVALGKTQGEAQVETIAELKTLLQGTNIISRMPRVVQKCVWYVEKLRAIEEKFVALRDAAITAPPSCDLAYELVYLASYYYRNAEKFIAFLVYLETALLQVDLAVAQSGIGVRVGEIIQPGADVIPIDLAADAEEDEGEGEGES